MIRSTVSPVLKIGFQFFGIWPDVSYSTVHSMSIISSVLIIQYFQYLYIFKHFKISEISNLNESLNLTFIYGLTVFKLIYLWIRRQVFRQILVTMDNDWRECINMDKYLYIMTIKANLAHFISNSILSISVIIAIPYFLGEYIIHSVFLTEDQNNTLRPLPMKIQLPFDTQQSPIFEIVYVTLFLHSIIIFVYMVSIVNGLILTLVLHVSGQIDIMCHEYKNISKSISLHESTVSLFRMLIERHNRIISFSKNIEKLISFIALMQVVLDTLIICGLGFFIIISIHNEMGVFMVIRTIFAIALILAEVFIICFTGEHLNYKSKSIVNAAYELTWYDIPSHQSKMLILIIMRSQKQLTISAGKMMDMSFETYTNIIKTSVSYISIMNALY